jgi:hypothetical protein
MKEIPSKRLDPMRDFSLRSASRGSPSPSPKGVSGNFDFPTESSEKPSYAGIKTTHVINFGEPDSEENVVYSDKDVKFATFSKLVEKLTAATAEIGSVSFPEIFQAFQPLFRNR